MKRIASLLLAVIMVLGVGIYVPNETLAADVAWAYGGAGTASSPYIIDTAEEFTAFMTNVTTGSVYSGKYFRVDSDIEYNVGYSFTFDEKSGLVKVSDSAGTALFCLGTGIPGTARNRGYVTHLIWENISVAGKTYAASSLTGALTEAAVTIPFTPWAFSGKNVSFAGELDFNGHAISGVYARAESGSVGIFATVKGNATIKNLTVKNSYFYGTTPVGAVAGSVGANAKFLNCVNEATVCASGTASNGAFLGGIAGMTSLGYSPKFIACENKGQACLQFTSTTYSNATSGGIVGYIRGGDVIACKNSGIVFAGGSWACGGIVGYADCGPKNTTTVVTTRVYGCINTGKVNSLFDRNVVNYPNETKTQSYPTGAPVGGIVGFLDPYWSKTGSVMEVKYCYNGGSVREGAYAGSASVYGDIVGKMNKVCSVDTDGGVEVRTCSVTVRITDNVSVNDSNLAVLLGGSVSGVHAYYTAENNRIIKTGDYDKNTALASFADEANSFLAKLSDCSYIWYNGSDMETVGYGNNVYDKNGYVDFKQDGSKEDPVIIDSLQDLKDLRDAVNGGKTYDGIHFAITKDIDLSSEANWEPIGNGTYGTNPAVYFGGKLYGAKPDGTPAVISGLKINSTDETTKPKAFVGINRGEISNLAFTGASVNAKRYAAIIVGENIGTVKNCSTDALSSVNLNAHKAAASIGNDYDLAPAGGICAANLGAIENCKNSASVTSDYSHAGGIVGNNLNAVSYCTNYGDISANCTAGGVVGHLTGNGKIFGTVSYSGNMANVTVTGSHAGGVVGWSRFAGGISYCFNSGTIRGTGESADIKEYTKSMISGILGCGNKNDLKSGNPYVIEYCYNVGDVYTEDGHKPYDDITGYVDGYGTTRYLKATKSNSDGIHDGIYVRIDGVNYASVPLLLQNNKQSYDASSELIATSAAFSNGTLKLTFSEPVTKSRSSYMAIRFCKVNESGVPSLGFKDIDGDGDIYDSPFQIDLTSTEWKDNTVTLQLQGSTFKTTGTADEIIAAAAANKEFAPYLDEYVPLLCFEGLDVDSTNYEDREGIIDAITNSTQPTSYRGNYGLYAQRTVATVTAADAKSGALCEFLNKELGSNIFTQNIGVDACPVINGETDSIKLERNSDGTYTVPALIGNASNEGSLVGYRDQDGNVHGAGAKISYQYVSPVYENVLVLKYGAAVRIISADTTGIRWTAKINADALSAAGYTVESKGFIIAPTAYVTGEWAVLNNKNVKAKKIAQDFTAEALSAVGLDYIDVKVDGFTAGSTEFAASVKNLNEENFSLGYSARAYLDVKDASGKQKRIYSGFESASGEVYYSYADAAASNSRSPGEIAKKALSDLSATAVGTYRNKIEKASDAFIKENSAAYPASVYYSPYNAQARQNLYEFILTLPEKAEDEKIFYPKYDNAEEYAQMRAELEKWIREQLSSGDGAIFSAEVETIPTVLSSEKLTNFATLSGRWTTSAITETEENGNKILTKTYTDSTSKLTFTTTVILYGDTPTADIKTVVKNNTSSRSLVLKNFYAIDASYALAPTSKNIKLTTLVGSYASVNDFDLVERNLTTEFVAPVLCTKEEDSFQRIVTNEHTVFYPTGSDGKGYSSSGHAFPYFDLIGDGKGLMMAIGWTAQWEGSFKKDTAGNAVIKARQQYLKTYLEAGESIEAPRIVLTYFEGDREYGHNIWREMMLSHYTPDNDRNPDNENNFVAPISANFWGGYHDEMIKTSVANLVDKGAKFDIVWLDAGWYGNLLYSRDAVFNTENPDDKAKWETYIAANPNKGFNSASADSKTRYQEWVEFQGDYIENEFLFPDGIEEIGKFVDNTNAQKGTDLKFMLWWMIFDRRQKHGEYLYPDGTVAEPADSVTKTQFLTSEEIAQYKGTYPNLANFTDSDYLNGGARLDLSQESVLNKLIDYYKYMSDVKGVDAVRLDNCNPPLTSMRTNDVTYQNDHRNGSLLSKETGANGVDDTDFYRDGYTENKWTTNEYLLWDALRAHSDDFFLDNTASGGRRLDIELVRRSAALWRSDLNDPAATPVFYEAHQKMTQNLALWIPITSAGYLVGTNDYASRSLYSAAATLNGPNAFAKGEILNGIVKRTHELVDLRPYWYGEYYQLLPVNTDADSWQSYELYRDDWDEGMLVVICRQSVTQTEDITGKTLTKTVKLKGLDSCATYRIHNIDDVNGDNDFCASGAELMSKGVTVTSTNKEINTYKIILVD